MRKTHVYELSHGYRVNIHNSYGWIICIWAQNYFAVFAFGMTQYLEFNEMYEPQNVESYIFAGIWLSFSSLV